MAGALCISASAHAQLESTADSGVASGQLAFVPYFLATGSTRTEITFRNVGPPGAWAFQLSEARNNRIIATRAVNPADFADDNYGSIGLYMEPNASVTFEIADQGSRRVLRRVAQSGDVCTVPNITGTGVELLGLTWSGGNLDGLGTDADRTKQGTSFAIPMAEIFGTAASQLAQGNCTAINARWNSGGAWWNDPTDDVLSGHSLAISAEVNLLDPRWRARVPSAFIADFYSAGFSTHTQPGSALPNLLSARQAFGSTFVTTPLGVVVEFPFSGGSNPDTFSAYLQTARTFVHRYSIGVDAASNTTSDVVIVSQPAKRYYTDPGLVGSAILPYTSRVNAAGYLGEPVIICATAPVPPNQSVCPLGAPSLRAPFYLKNAVTALRLIDPAAAPTAAPFPAITSDTFNVPSAYANTANGPASAIGLDFGPITGVPGAANRSITVPGGVSLPGLPAYAFILRRQFLQPGDAIAAQEAIGNEIGVNGDLAGTSTDSAAGVVVVGAPEARGGLGEVYVFAAPLPTGTTSPGTLRGRNLVRIATLTANSSVIGDKFGRSVALSPDANTLVIGMPGRSSGTGGVMVFRKPAQGWASSAVPTATLSVPSTPNGTTRALGESVAIDSAGNIAVGAPLSTVSGASEAGAGFYYRPVAGNYGAANLALMPTAPQTGGRHGTAVAAALDRVVVGAPGQDVDGAMFTYRNLTTKRTYEVREAEKTMARRAKDIGDKFRFGAAIDVQGPITVVTSPGEDSPTAVDGGSARVYLTQGNTNVPIAELFPRTQAGDNAGDAISITSDFISLGAPAADRGGKPDSGAAFVFDAPEGGWSSLLAAGQAGQVARFTRSSEIKPVDGTPGQRFGAGMAIAGRTIVAGAPGRTVVTATRQVPSQGEIETFGIDRILVSSFE